MTSLTNLTTPTIVATNTAGQTIPTTSQIAFMCLHAGLSDRDSVEVLQIIEDAGLIEYIIPIEIKTAASKQLILSNTSGVSVTQLPSIVISQGGGISPLVLPGKMVNVAIDMVNSIVIN